MGKPAERGLIRHSDGEIVAGGEGLCRAVLDGDIADVVNLAGHWLSTLDQNLLEGRYQFVGSLKRRVGDAENEETRGFSCGGGGGRRAVLGAHDAGGQRACALEGSCFTSLESGTEFHDGAMAHC